MAQTKKKQKQETVEIRINEEGTRMFRCGRCDVLLKNNQFQHTHSLEQHLWFNHNEDKWFVCNICGLRFQNIESLEEHKNDIHRQAANYSYYCQQCIKGFNENAAFKKHNLKTHAPKPKARPARHSIQRPLTPEPQTLTCEICQFECDSTAASTTFLPDPMLPFVCPRCFKRRDKENSLNFQSKKNSGPKKNPAGLKKLSCQKCGKLVFGKNVFGKHAHYHKRNDSQNNAYFGS